MPMLLAQMRVPIASWSAPSRSHTQTKRQERKLLSFQFPPHMRLLRALPTSGLTPLHRDMESPSCETSDSGFSAYLGCSPAHPASSFFLPHPTLSFALTLPHPFCPSWPFFLPPFPSLPSLPPFLPLTSTHCLSAGPAQVHCRRMLRGPTAAAAAAPTRQSRRRRRVGGCGVAAVVVVAAGGGRGGRGARAPGGGAGPAATVAAPLRWCHTVVTAWWRHWRRRRFSYGTSCAAVAALNGGGWSPP